MCFAWNVSNRGCICSYTNNLWIISVQLFIAQWRVLCGRKNRSAIDNNSPVFAPPWSVFASAVCSLAILNFVVIFDSSSFGGRHFLNFLLKRGDIVSLTSIKCDYTRQSHRLRSSYGIELWYRRLYSRRCRCQFTHHKSICVSFDLFNSHVWVLRELLCVLFLLFRLSTAHNLVLRVACCKCLELRHKNIYSTINIFVGAYRFTNFEQNSTDFCMFINRFLFNLF